MVRSAKVQPYNNLANNFFRKLKKSRRSMRPEMLGTARGS
jgi:hypothetical protein